MASMTDARHVGALAVVAVLMSLPLACTLDRTAPATGGATSREMTATAVTGTQPAQTPDAGVQLVLDSKIGVAAVDRDIRPLDIDVSPSGAGLPGGHGTVPQGQSLFASLCAGCHGADGRTAGVGPQLVSEPGPWKPGMPQTIGSYWPYATTVFDYVRRAMPFNAPGSLTDEQVYALTAWLLNQNKIVDGDAEMNRETLPAVKMPNRDSFFACWPQECQPDVP
jgi:cytochrome c